MSISEQVIAPALAQLVRLEGDPQQGRFVRNVVFRGLQFAHADWTMDEKGYADTQAALPAAAAIEAAGALDCTIEKCHPARSRRNNARRFPGWKAAGRASA
jgi:hypothetical protein